METAQIVQRAWKADRHLRPRGGDCVIAIRIHDLANPWNALWRLAGEGDQLECEPGHRGEICNFLLPVCFHGIRLLHVFQTGRKP